MSLIKITEVLSDEDMSAIKKILAYPLEHLREKLL